MALPSLAEPDNDPRLWLEEVDGAAALEWVATQNARTLALFSGAALDADADALAEIMDRPDNIPFVTRRGGQLYNLWKDADHPRGLWRRTSLTSFQSETPDWEIVLDIDALAASEGEDWVFQGATVAPDTHDIAILSLSRGGSDASVLREFDLAARAFVLDGFKLAQAKSSVTWFDRDTLLLASALGEGNATSSGYARTIRLWRRGSDPAQAPVIFGIATDHMAAGVQVDREEPSKRLSFIDRRDFYNGEIWLGDLGGPKLRLDIPSDISSYWHRGWYVLRPKSPWTIGDATYPPGMMLGIDRDAYLGGSRDFEVLFTPDPRSVCTGFQWVDGRLVIEIMDNLVPRHEVLTPSATGWTRVTLTGLPALGVVSVWRFDEDNAESDGSLLASVSDPLTPSRLLLTSTTLAPPFVLKQAPAAFRADGLVVTRHEARSPDGTMIPYTQIGPSGLTGDAPVHLYGYGGFEIPIQPAYRAGIGKLWLERGGTSVLAHLRGGGEFGAPWHKAGIREGKALSHDDFAAIAGDLVTRGVTKPSRIAAEGGSNGGILITNMLARYPERFGALFCTIPLVDMRRYTKLLAGASWIAEYGDPDKPEDWAFLQHISAYHTVTADGAAPPILLATTRRDDRVHPGHARKMAAKLADMRRDAWFYELDTGGHSYGKTNRERAHFTALGYAFLRQAIGWTHQH
jgi:prolyl oligopeptidase